MNEKIAEALGHVDGQYVAAAARRKKHKKRIFLGAIAAILAMVMLTNLPTIPFVVTAKAVALASDSRIPERPMYSDWISEERYKEKRDAWHAAYDPNYAAAMEALENLRPFFHRASETLLTGEENKIWSPANAAIALAILAETADGTTRQELLDVLGVEHVETLRRYASGLWEMSFEKDRHESSTLANSLWLDNGMQYDQDVMNILAHDYFASVYQGDLGSGTTNSAMTNWVNNQTGGFLRQKSAGIDLSSDNPEFESVLALLSTAYVYSKWIIEFNEGMNTEGVFHAPRGDTAVTYMNMKKQTLQYHWGESYGAVRLPLEGNTSMYLILPDEDKTVSDVLAEGEYLNVFLPMEERINSDYYAVNLSVPKFDISSELDLKEGFEQMGVTKVFHEHADFGTTFETDRPVFVNQIKQAARVSIDEEGVTAASYLILEWGAGAAAPSEEIVDFVLDRPFLFAITASDGIPMFLGMVNQP